LLFKVSDPFKKDQKLSSKVSTIKGFKSRSYIFGASNRKYFEDVFHRFCLSGYPLSTDQFYAATGEERDQTCPGHVADVFGGGDHEHGYLPAFRRPSIPCAPLFVSPCCSV